jgi:hypothetical protein
MGVLFTRRVILDGHQVGALSAGIAMKTREIYRGGQLCIGAVGRPPFMQQDN